MMRIIAAMVVAAAVSVAAQGQPDFSKVEIKTTEIAGNLYMLEGQGGAIGVLTGPDGVFMVDTQFAPLIDRIVAAIKQISDGHIRFVVNTHVEDGELDRLAFYQQSTEEKPRGSFLIFNNLALCPL